MINFGAPQRLLSPAKHCYGAVYFWHVAAPVVLGASIYVLARSTSLLVFVLLVKSGLGEALSVSRGAVEPMVSLLPEWSLYSLPDGLWVYAVTAFMALFWREESGWTKWLWISSGLLLGMAVETSQLTSLVPGTFDRVDLGVMLLAFTIAIGMLATSRHGEGIK